MQPKPTGLEGMPEFSTSLGCMDAPHVYQGGKVEFTVPVGQNQGRGDHSMDFRGGAVGTITLVQGADDLTEIKYELTVRTDNAELLGPVVLDYPTADEVDTARKSSRVQLATPGIPEGDSACMRFDATVHVPPRVQTLHVQTHATAQVRFDAASELSLGSLSVSMYKRDKRNVLLLAEGARAARTKLRMSEGWLVGDLSVGDDASLMTQDGDAVLNVRVHPAPSAADPPAPVKLATTTGAGRADVVYVERGAPHRPIDASHVVAMHGDLYLTYTDAAFNGTVDLAARSYSATGLQGTMQQQEGLPYVGSRSGGDRMVVKSQGWAGLYF